MRVTMSSARVRARVRVRVRVKGVAGDDVLCQG